jgi:hypothetical protein
MCGSSAKLLKALNEFTPRPRGKSWSFAHIGLLAGDRLVAEPTANPPQQKAIEQQVSKEVEGEIVAVGTTQRTQQIHPSIWGQAGLFRLRSAEGLPEGALTFGVGGEFYSVTNGPLIGGVPNAATTIAESLFVGYSPWKDWNAECSVLQDLDDFRHSRAADEFISSLGDFTFSGAYSARIAESMAITPL